MQTRTAGSPPPHRNTSTAGLPSTLKVVFPSITCKLRNRSPYTPQGRKNHSHSRNSLKVPSLCHTPILKSQAVTGKSVAAKVYDFSLGHIRLHQVQRRGRLLDQYGRGFELLRQLSGSVRQNSSSVSSERSLEKVKSILERKQSCLSVEMKVPKRTRRERTWKQRNAGYVPPIKFASNPLDDVKDVHHSLYRAAKPSLRLT